ncbi:MAG: SufE family protein [Alphaproteobacteria bacterium]|nr:SufE family protein [Alphaproteobacteria bacterium]
MELDRLKADLELLDDWEDKYQHIIDLGKLLPHAPHEDAFKVDGCISQVWVQMYEKDGRIFMNADSDALIVKGLLAIIWLAVNDKTRQEVAGMDLQNILEILGLAEYISPNRRNGFANTILRIRNFAS